MDQITCPLCLSNKKYSSVTLLLVNLLQVQENNLPTQSVTRAEASAGVNATGSKPNYYSLNTCAADFGYQPGLTSLEGIFKESEAILA